MTLLDAHTVTTAERLADEWLAAFGTALESGDTRTAAALFAPDGHWRDLLSFTWQLRTFSGPAQIREALAETLAATGVGNLVRRSHPAPRVVWRAGRELVEAFFDFTTAVGRGSGVVRIVDGVDGARAWVVLTTLEELTGFEEPTGERRPRGDVYSRNFGQKNWLDHRTVEQEYSDRDPAVLVVGGGQAGLGVAARLRHLGVDALVVDRMQRVGDNWRQRYHSLALHNQVWVNHLPYLPFPDAWPVYVPKDKLANWFESYVDTMEINFWTSTEFVGARYDPTARCWSATVLRDGAERVLAPRHIVMATGVSGIPNVPDIPGIEDFAGQVLHSSTYREGADQAGRRALVIGTGNSGHDVAQDLHSYGAAVTMVQRSPTTVVQVEPTAQRVYALYTEGPPTADCDLLFAATPYPVLVQGYQQLTEQARVEDRELREGLRRIGFRTDDGPDETGYQMKYLRRGGGYYLNVGCSDLLIEGAIGLLQFADVQRIVPDGALLRDGTTVPADLIVLATGYLTQQDLVRDRFGDAVADAVGPIWGWDDHGELANMWTRTAQEGLWFTAGSLAQSRIYSAFLALQIKACEEGLIDPAAPPLPRALALADRSAGP